LDSAQATERVWYAPSTWLRQRKGNKVDVPEPVVKASAGLIQIIGLEQYEASMKATNYTEIKKALHGLVYVLEEKRADALAMADYSLVHNGEPFEGTAEAQQFYRVFKRPNEFTSQYELIRNTSIILDQLGNAYWWFGYDRMGRVQEITLLRSEWMEVMLTEAGKIAGWKYTKPGQAGIMMKPNEVAHLKYPDPYDTIYGYSVLMRAALDVDLDNIMAQSTYGFLKNKSIPPIILKSKVQLTSDQIEEAIHKWNAQLRGKDRAGNMIVLAGGLECEVVNVAQDQFMFLAGRADARKRIAAIFGVPEQMFGYVENANRSIMESMEYVFKTQTVKKLARMFGDALEAFVLPKFGLPLEVDIDIDVDIPIDKEFELEKYKAGIPMAVYTADEMRAEFGDEPLPDGAGERLFREMRLVEDAPGEKPVGVEPPEPSPQPPSPSSNEPEEEPQAAMTETDTEPMVGEAAAAASDFPGSVLPSKAQRDAYVVAADRQREPWIRLMEEKLTTYFIQQSGRILKALRTRKDLRQADADAIMQELQKEDEYYSEAVLATLIAMTMHFGSEAIEQVGGTAIYERVRAVQLVGKGLEERSKLINSTTAEKLRELLQQGMAEGIGRDEMGRRIKELFVDMTPARAATIARTEAGRAVTLAQQDGWRLAGMEGREWVTWPDHRNTDFHNSISGKVAATGEPYPNIAGISAMGPRLTGVPGEDCNCRCHEAPVRRMNS